MDNQREETIRARAKELWEQEGKPDGRDEEIWFRAAEEFDSGRLEVGARPAPETTPQQPF